MVTEPVACTVPDACGLNLARIHLMSGDFASAYRVALPMAEAGDIDSIGVLIEICEKAGDAPRAESWRERLPAG